MIATSIVIFENNEDLRNSLRLLLDGTDDLVVRGDFVNCEKVKEIIEEHKPDVVMMDIDMPVVDGISGLKIIKEHRPETRVVMLTVFDDNSKVFEALQNGADGYLLKKSTPAQIISAIKEVQTGGAPMTPAVARKVLSFFSHNKPKDNAHDLTPKETEVLKLLVEGFSYKMIAAELAVSIDTVRSHIKNIYSKLQVHSMSEAVAKALRERIV